MTEELAGDRREHLGAALDAIRQRAPLTVQQLDALNVLEGDDLDRFREAWETLDPDARRELIEWLRASADERQRLDFSPINLVALHDPMPEVRLTAVQAAFEDRSPALMDRLLELLRTDPSPDVREAAADDVARFALLGELGDLDADQTRRVRQALVDAVHDPSEEARVRSTALGAAGYFTDRDMAQMLGAGFTNPDLELGAVRGMGRSADPRWTEQLLTVLDNPSPRLRLEAVRALGEIEDERAVDALSELTDDSDEAVQLAVIRALGDIGGDEARDTLLYLLEDGNQVVREAAEEAIRQLEFYEDPLGL
jgi:HEAT repeat protein